MKEQITKYLITKYPSCKIAPRQDSTRDHRGEKLVDELLPFTDNCPSINEIFLFLCPRSQSPITHRPQTFRWDSFRRRTQRPGTSPASCFVWTRARNHVEIVYRVTLHGALHHRSEALASVLNLPHRPLRLRRNHFRNVKCDNDGKPKDKKSHCCLQGRRVKSRFSQQATWIVSYEAVVSLQGVKLPHPYQIRVRHIRRIRPICSHQVL